MLIKNILKTCLSIFFISCAEVENPYKEEGFKRSLNIKKNEYVLLEIEDKTPAKAPVTHIQHEKAPDLHHTKTTHRSKFTPDPHSSPPFYCNPLRFPPQLIRNIKGCDPYMDQPWMQKGFYLMNWPIVAGRNQTALWP